MKKTISILAILSVIFCACDTIPENERTINTDLGNFKKTVLLFDFTGWQCTNCPEAARMAHNLQETAGEKLIVVSLHPKGIHWTEPTDSALDLRSNAATEYWSFFDKPDAFPIGTVDIIPYNDNLLIDRIFWSAAIAQRIVKEMPLDLEVSCGIDTLTSKIAIKSKISASSETSETEIYSLILLVMENKVIGAQIDNGVRNNNYEHNHVLRDAINGVWGEPFFSPKKDDFIERTAEYQANSAWKIKNCDVVGIIINAQTKEVVAAQTAEKVFE
ncbi:MAG: Omp28 family outer membrane lipoprotein [Prevotellaceae bacterium]|jgi:hypothetical protein|nr:Omp28 family outer membrane lipoprotein [Prevotellaceae bacterium]